METAEGFSGPQAWLLKQVLNDCALNGLENMSLQAKARTAQAMAMYRMDFSDAYALYAKYISGWGDAAGNYRFEAIRDGQVVKTVVKAPASAILLQAKADHGDLLEETTYDVSAVRVTAVDENGNLLRFFQDSVDLETQGPIALIGPDRLELRGGSGGTYVKTLGTPGAAALILRHPQAGTVRLEFNVEIKE